MEISCEVDIALGCVLAYIYKNYGSIFPLTTMDVWFIFGMWEPYLFNDKANMYSDLGEDFVQMCAHMFTYIPIHAYTHTPTHVSLATYMPKYMHSYMHACTHACLHTYKCMQSYIHACIYTYILMDVSTHMHANTHAYTLA